MQNFQCHGSGNSALTRTLKIMVLCDNNSSENDALRVSIFTADSACKLSNVNLATLTAYTHTGTETLPTYTTLLTVISIVRCTHQRTHSK